VILGSRVSEVILSVSEMNRWIALGEISLANESRKVFRSFFETF
jgi:hypothetical protein